jgi:nitrous oxidase accessory protein NosD
VYHNNFINNEEHVSPYKREPYDIWTPRPPESHWDNGREGNFWSNYNGTDTNGDGIGETAYLASSYHNITDRFPLTKPYPVALNPPTTTSPPPQQSPEPVATSTPSSSPTQQPTASLSPTPDAIADPYYWWIPYTIIALAVVSVGLTIYFMFLRSKKKER